MNTRNLTLALPEDLVTRLKVIAAQRDTSISAMAKQSLERLAEEGDGYEAAMRDLLDSARRGYRTGKGTGGQINWTRESTYERGV